jgi:glutamate-1-semialdehyde aminotransferase
MVNEKFIQNHNAKSRQLWERSCKVIVGGGQAHKRPVDFMVRGGPSFMVRGEGSRVWDADGHEYIDYLLAYGPIVLGHSDPIVNEAVRTQMKDGTVYSVEHPLEIELAEQLVEMIPCAEMVMYFVGGSSTTLGAIRCARAHTKREKIIRCGYHGWYDWCVPDNPGVPKFNQDLIIGIGYDDLPALKKTLEANAGQVAGVMIESVQFDGPSPGYFDGVRRLCDEHGAVFVVDEVKTGFRFDLGGAQVPFKINADLATFGKAMCNGYPGSVLVGKREIMEPRTDTHMAATFHGDLLSIVAAQVVIEQMKRRDGIAYFQKIGQRLIDGMNEIFTDIELPMKVTGFAPMPWPQETNEKDPNPCPEKYKGKVLIEYCAALQRKGIYATSHPWFLSMAHTEDDIEKTLAIAGDAAAEAREVLANGVKQPEGV